MKKTIQSGWEIVRFRDGQLSADKEVVAKEYPLTIVVNGNEFATMVCTPTYIHELIIGFLVSEGLIHSFAEINSLQVDEDRGFAYIEINKVLDTNTFDHSKRFIGSCCGKSRQFYFKSDVRTAKTVVSQLTIHVEQCIHLMAELQSKSTQFQQTGGVHNAALCTSDELLIIRTDIGRHNTLDKLYGYVLKHKLPLANKIIVFSGRISSEVLLKVSKMGVGIIISKSAPTDLALKLANDLGITTIGFARGKQMNIYTHPHRIHGTDQFD